MKTKDADRTINSLREVNDFPFYTARYYGDYKIREFSEGAVESSAHAVPFFEDMFAELGKPVKLSFPVSPGGSPACSAFFCRNEEKAPLIGKNLDWRRDPVLLLKTKPPGGYPSLSLVNLNFCDLFGLKSFEHSLLLSPYVPLDGMNEAGLVVSVLSVDGAASYPEKGNKPSVGDLNMVRVILDSCRNVEKACASFGRYHLMRTGPLPVHYLLADRKESCVVEFFDGKMHLRKSPSRNFLTNFLCLKKPGERESSLPCPRYGRLKERLTEPDKPMDTEEAEKLLRKVSVYREGFEIPSTIWSLVYAPEELKVRIRIGQKRTVYTASPGGKK